MWMRIVSRHADHAAAFLVVGALMAVTGGGLGAAALVHPSLDQVREATADFRTPGGAEHHGYTQFADAEGNTCIGTAGSGDVGTYWVDETLVADPTLDPLRPDALVYVPDRSGTLVLAAVQYLVLRSDWDAVADHPPQLWGRAFTLVEAPNRYNRPAFYSLNVWVWRHNPAGTFVATSPAVHCPATRIRAR
jgi:hypothetical protein